MQITVTQDHVKELLNKQITRFFQNVQVNASIEEKRLVRIEVKIANRNLLQWLIHQTDAIKTYWRDRENEFEMAGVGEADQVSGEIAEDDTGPLFERLKKYLRGKYPRLRYYGGIRFDQQRKSDPYWQRFGAYRFIVPLFEMYFDGNSTYFACNFLFNPLKNSEHQLSFLQERLHQISWTPPDYFSGLPELLSRRDYPDRRGWWRNIRAALRLFAQKSLEKVVLARKSEFEFSDNLNPLQMLQLLQQTEPTAYYFCFQPLKNYAFIGGTPERLYRRTGGEIISEAVAGTRTRGQTAEEDAQLEHALLHSEKELREHRFVVNSVRETLQRICSQVFENPKIFVLKLSRVQHLYGKIRGVLRSDATDREILNLLHPTPAVGGVPKNIAREKIAELEGFDRGWYAGPIGWVGQDAAEFAVAIRSGLVAENKLFLYSGAGIVAGSHPEKEWEEIESKIGNFLKALDCDV